MITLFGSYRSRATRNIWLMTEAGIPFEIKPVLQAYRLADPAAPGAPLNTRSPEWLAKHPAGGIPALQDGEVFMGESIAMNLYLARHHGGSFGPQSPKEEAEMLHWAFFAATSLEPETLAIGVVHWDGKQATPEGRATIEAASARLSRWLGALEAHLATRSFMVADRFTVADINTAECLRYGQPEPGLYARFPKMNDWLTAMQARPAFKEMMAKREAEPA